MSSLWDKEMSVSGIEEWLYGGTSLNGATRDWFISRAKEWSKGTALLDAGCGGGVTAYQLSKEGLLPRVVYTGVDGSKNMLSVAKKKTEDVTWIHSDLGEYRAKRKFPKILLRAVLAHVYDPEPVLKSCFANLKKDGELFIIFWNNSVQGESVFSTVTGGFYDIGHSEEKLKAIIAASSMEISETHKISEASARGDVRDIWVVKHA